MMKEGVFKAGMLGGNDGMTTKEICLNYMSDNKI